MSQAHTLNLRISTTFGAKAWHDPGSFQIISTEAPATSAFKHSGLGAHIPSLQQVAAGGCSSWRIIWDMSGSGSPPRADSSLLAKHFCPTGFCGFLALLLDEISFHDRSIHNISSLTRTTPFGGKNLPWCCWDGIHLALLQPLPCLAASKVLWSCRKRKLGLN